MSPERTGGESALPQPGGDDWIRPLDCIDLVELVTAYLDDAVDARTRASIEVHLEICQGCAEYVAQMKSTVRLTGGITDNDIDPEFRGRLLQAFRDWRAP